MSYELRRLNLHSRMSETEIERQMRGHLLRQWRRTGEHWEGPVMKWRQMWRWRMMERLSDASTCPSGSIWPQCDQGESRSRILSDSGAYWMNPEWSLMKMMKMTMSWAFATLCVKLRAQKMLWMSLTDWSVSGPCCAAIESQTACQTCQGLKWSSQHRQRSEEAL